VPLLHPTQRKSFTIDKPTALYYAARLANGERLCFQSTANRNWVAKLARTRYGVKTKVFAVKDCLIDPRLTIEGKDLPYNGGNEHYMTFYVAERDYAVKLPIVTTPTRRSWREDYVR
jgi:hypothetical protein